MKTLHSVKVTVRITMSKAIKNFGSTYLDYTFNSALKLRVPTFVLLSVLIKTQKKLFVY